MTIVAEYELILKHFMSYKHKQKGKHFESEENIRVYFQKIKTYQPIFGYKLKLVSVRVPKSTNQNIENYQN